MPQSALNIPATQPIEKWLQSDLLSTIKAFVKLHPKTYAISISCLITIGLIDISIPWLVGITIDGVREQKYHATELWQMFGLLIFLGFAMYGLRYVWRWILFGTSYRLSVQLRNYLYTRLSKLGPAFYQRHRTGDLMARATNDVDNIEMTAGEAILAAFDGFLTFVLVVAVMIFSIDWRLALLSLIPFPIMALVFRHLGDKIHHAFSDALDKFGELNDHTQQALAGFKSLKSMGLQSVLEEEFNQLSEAARKANFKVARIEALFDPLVLLALGTSTFMSLIAGTWLIWEDQITIGQLTSFYLYQGFLIWPMFAFGWFLNLYNRGSAALKRYHELVTEPDSISNQGNVKVQSPYQIDVSVNRFTYDGAAQASLHDIKLSILSGQSIGIVGPTGSGKSTLLSLLQRQHELHDGSIEINGTNIKDISLEGLRNLFTLVPQEPIMFSDSLKANISLGKPDAGDVEIDKAIALAQLKQDIEQMKQGLNTLVGEKGVTLSGGQRQRVALARALLRSSPFLVLDDTLSAVDTETERKLLSALAQTGAQRSLIIVSHRLSAIQHCDFIMVLNQGTVIEQGSHQELLKNAGWYSAMFAHQELEEDLDE